MTTTRLSNILATLADGNHERANVNAERDVMTAFMLTRPEVAAMQDRVRELEREVERLKALCAKT